MIISSISSIVSNKGRVRFSGHPLTYDEINEHIKRGQIEQIKTLPDLFIVNKKFDTLLHSSARANQVNISRFLLSKNLDPNCPNINGQTPFAIACSKLNSKLAETFLLYDIDINTKDNLKNTPLHRGIQSPEIVNLLLNNAANPHSANIFSQTPYRMSIDYPNSLEVFLKHKINPNTVDKNGQTLLHEAMIKKNMEIAAILKKYNADVNYKDNLGKSPLFYAQIPASIDWLSDNGAKINLTDKKHNTALHYSVMDNNGAIAKALLKHNADTNIKNSENLPAIAYSKSFGMTKLLIENGADANILVNGTTILHKYVKRNDLKAVYFLVKNKINPNIADKNGFIPMDYAQDGGIKTLLLVAGTNPNYNNYLIKALKSKDFEFFSNLLEVGADANKTNKKGQTPIFFIDNEKELKELLKYNADINHKDKYGNTAILRFALLGRRDLVKLLKENNAVSNEDELKKCFDKYDNYHCWIKSDKIKSAEPTFTGNMDYKIYATPEIRESLNYKIKLKEKDIDNIIKNATTTDEGLTAAYNALKTEEQHIKEAMNGLSVVVKHFTIDAKIKMREIVNSNPSGSKIPIIGTLKQYNDTVLTDIFKAQLECNIYEIRSTKNDIKDTYYNKQICTMVNDYCKLNDYLSEGIKYVSYIDKSTPTREKMLQNLETCKDNIIKRNTKLKTSLNNLSKNYESCFNKIMKMQKEKQSYRTIKKTIMLFFHMDC